MDFPIFQNGGVSLLTDSGNPLLCGGHSQTQTCFEFVPEANSFVESSTSLIGRRWHSAYAEFGTGAYWILSSNLDDAKGTSEIYENGVFREGPSLAALSNADYPCAAKVDDDITFYIGTRAYAYSRAQDRFLDISSNLPLRERSSCGAFTASDGSRRVVVAGGIDNSFNEVEEVYIYDFDTGEWTRGPDLPIADRLAREVQTEKSFFLLGGRADNNEYLDTVIEFDPIAEQWILRDETLSRGKYLFYAAPIDASLFCS